MWPYIDERCKGETERKEMAKNEKTSAKVASIASKLLSNPKTPANVKTVAASVLTQAPDHKRK